MTKRGDLTDQQWERLAPLLPPEKGKRGRPCRNHRDGLNGILWVKRTGAPWRDLPPRYPPFGTCHGRLTAWQRDGVWERVLQTLLAEADQAGDLNWLKVAIDSTTVRAHQHAAGARREPAKRRRDGKRGVRSRLLGRRSDAAVAA
jgi:transposase